MKSYTLPELDRCLTKMEISSGELVMVHSSLLGLGQLNHQRMSDAPKLIADLLLDRIGPTGTLVVPALNFGFCRGKTFDRQHTPSEKMGLLSEYVRCLPNAVRSRHPMQSVAAVGPLAERICEPDTPSAFDKGSSFDFMIGINARLLLLGATFQAATVIHYAEQMVGVPYRLWKTFSGTYIDSGQELVKQYRMYVRDLEMDPKLEMSSIESELIARNQLVRLTLGAGQVRSCTFQDLVGACNDCLRRDANCLVSQISQ